VQAPSASEAAALSGSGDAVIGWKLDADQRRVLISQFPPMFRNSVADHVTLVAHAAHDAPLPRETEGQIVGHCDDGEGVEAMIVEIGGTTDRPDGGTYHMTWSLADGREGGESNDVIAERGWVDFDVAIPVTLCPARFD
jgi:hypothetical protein